ncbi:MAG: 30S ribosomal protein S5 [bacterium]|nr:30S ribosomal protein S5 [bacterium]
MPLQQQQHRRYQSRFQRPKDDFEVKLIDLARVTRVAAGGKHMSFRAVVIGGDHKGKVGLGIGKGQDVAQAIEKAGRNAKKNVIMVLAVEDTIAHEVEAKFGPSRVLLKPQVKGRGLVAGGPVRVICQLAGIKNISAKYISGTHNKVNNAMAVITALKKLPKHAAPSTQTKA